MLCFTIAREFILYLIDGNIVSSPLPEIRNHVSNILIVPIPRNRPSGIHDLFRKRTAKQTRSVLTILQTKDKTHNIPDTSTRFAPTNEQTRPTRNDLIQYP